MLPFSTIRSLALSCIALTASAGAVFAQTTIVETVAPIQSGIPAAIASLTLVLLCLSGIMGLIVIGTGMVRLYDARVERRATPPSKRIKYSEGIWRLLLGSGMVITAVAARML
ncbi:hypothetical protein G6L37_00370 [Agrobacterium rubi]|nr:hypothetical protein [Agrobacterium rubi]NTF23843.1 hypothetical protein [Agrobacterium rubi]